MDDETPSAPAPRPASAPEEASPRPAAADAPASTPADPPASPATGAPTAADAPHPRSQGEPPSPAEIRVPAARPPPRGSQLGWLFGIVAFGLATALFWPGAATSWVLPWGAFFGTLFFLRREPRLPEQLVSVGAEGLRCESTGSWTFTPWASVARLVDGQTTLTLHLLGGDQMALDLRGLRDVRPILALAPSSIPCERGALTAPPSNTRKTLALWLVLIVFLVVVWRLVGR